MQILKPEGQGNNAYIFPGLGLGALAAKATKLDESCLLVAASALAAEVDAESLAMGRYGPLKKMGGIASRTAMPSSCLAVVVLSLWHRLV